jgi:hypothetical protein
MKAVFCLFSLLLATRLFAGLGDLNNDKAINLDDCKLLAAKIASGEAVDLAIGDIDGNGTVSIVDAMRLHQSMGGLWVEPTGKIQPVPQLSLEERNYFAQYEEQCDQYDAMSPAAFLSKFQAAPAYASGLDPKQCTYFSKIDSVFKLTDDQKTTLKDQGMVVLNRKASMGSGFGGCYAEIYKNHLPVFFTSDALLDPLYRLYDNMLKEVELNYMKPALSSILTATQTQLDQYRQQTTAAAWTMSTADVATFLSVARALLDRSASISDNPKADSLLKLIATEKLVTVKDFFGRQVDIDFSQFKPRGHYECAGDCTSQTNLEGYFRCMMWLGRADCAFIIDSTDFRQMRDFLLIRACMDKAGVLNDLAKINQVVSFFVGDVDGFSIEGLSEILAKNSFTLETVMASDNSARSLQATIAKSGGGNQLIMSQALWKEPDAARPELPKIAQICGQRFILDSYMLGRTVEWYVKGRNKPLLEEVPFCLGNNAASTVISSDITTYTSSQGSYKPYHTRLGASRGLFEKYPYWDRNCYTLWLDALRNLSHPLPATTPLVMSSRTWQEKQMNTQLASWAQLRHNTLLYAKQSYTGSVSCFYPDGYVEPYPEFYRTVGKLIKSMQAFTQQFSTASIAPTVDFDAWRFATDTLALIAESEVQGKPLGETFIAFLNRMLVSDPLSGGCGGPDYAGWYIQLFGKTRGWDECRISKPCIADVHTIPPSEISPSNMVLHAATGDASLAVIQAATSATCGTLFVGAVSSFFQHDETPIKRLADSDWKTLLYGTNKPDVPAWFGKYIK